VFVGRHGKILPQKRKLALSYTAARKKEKENWLATLKGNSQESTFVHSQTYPNTQWKKFKNLLLICNKVVHLQEKQVKGKRKRIIWRKVIMIR
jgi:hypothetical protein